MINIQTYDLKEIRGILLMLSDDKYQSIVKCDRAKYLADLLIDKDE